MGNRNYEASLRASVTPILLSHHALAILVRQVIVTGRRGW